MHHKDIINKICETTNNRYAEKDVELVVNEFIECVVKAVSEGEEVQLKEIGKFYPKYFKGKVLSKSGIKWMNNKSYSIPPRFTLGFTPSRKAKSRVASFIDKIRKLSDDKQ